MYRASICSVQTYRRTAIAQEIRVLYLKRMIRSYEGGRGMYVSLKFPQVFRLLYISRSQRTNPRLLRIF